ncbi:uncharacterized protein CC84DRAFT_1145809 [Paraphaeosphaeria sporulosa]|uniref:Uncharacterized protein n=1 Tax=Paraphaeosphaeria sporulosa TaxID=1460663 RepID=A0A177CFK4_9PLEO|nr:uncharacterized protein CC84DRAFT_1145809 [Paraphaeosphaeria sporulosa]OAG06001.1 hypothetical protein CC84DRAFT_1145809 [Paraphaeosphaeria sporulosa]
MAAKSRKAANLGQSGKSGKKASQSAKSPNDDKVSKTKRVDKASKASDTPAQCTIRVANDCFGQTSPHWNLPFHLGNATAAELLAYLPHSLKGVDVVDRFVMNGGKAMLIAFMLNTYRTMRDDRVMSANSICVMMQCSMRAYGVKGWTAGKHQHTDVHLDPAPIHDPDSLDVSSFRTPCVSHPKKGFKKLKNLFAEPIEFRDLAQGVKQHPSGDDALDLTRCVLYAVNHPDESWLFPDDFVDLVNHLGGAQTPTPFHCDKQAFGRHLAALEAITAATPPKKRSYAKFSAPRFDTAASGEKRRSGRLTTQAVSYLQESDSDIDALYKNNEHEPPTKKRKSARASSAESEFTGNVTSDSESLGDVTGETSDEFLAPKPKRPVRASAVKGRILTQKAVHKETPKTPRAAKATRPYTPIVYAVPISGMPLTAAAPTAIFAQARALEARAPVQITAPVLDFNRIVIHDRNVWLYADSGCVTREDMFASAFCSERFDGPREQAPFRELHRLSDPDPLDMSDWAENIRWAKEQWLYFNADTWTEYGDHLEQITQWRRDHGWWSDTAIATGFEQ